jgi:hypothetical protein
MRQARTPSPISSPREESSAHVLAWYYVEGRLACRRVAVNSGVELTTGVEISIAAA